MLVYYWMAIGFYMLATVSVFMGAVVSGNGELWISFFMGLVVFLLLFRVVYGVVSRLHKMIFNL